MLEEIKEIVKNDLILLSPENEGNYSEPYHSAINNDAGYLGDFIPSQSGIITEYLSDGDYIRSYALFPNDLGVVIIVNKKYNQSTILILNEDDGAWFVESDLTWIYGKYKFVALISEALSQYNENYNEESINFN